MSSLIRQICRVVESEPTSRKIIVEIEGQLISAEKMLGIQFHTGDYACLQTSSEHSRNLVVALNPAELRQLHQEQKGETEFFETLEDVLSGRLEKNTEKINEGEPLGVAVALPAKKLKPLETLKEDLIQDQQMMEKIKTIFEDLPEKQLEEDVKDLFPILAIQTSSEYKESQEAMCRKADELLCRNLIYYQTNREVHAYLKDRIDQIKTEEDRSLFFKYLDYYLERLRLIQKTKQWSTRKMGVLFHPIYAHYVYCFGAKDIDEWIHQNKSKP